MITKYHLSNEKIWLALILLCAVILRIGMSFYMGNKVEDLPGIFDQISYDKIAWNVASGKGFAFDQDWWPMTKAGSPTSFWSYFMVFYLSTVYAIFGHHPLIARLIQAIIAGVLLPLLTYRLGRRMGKAVGLIAAGLSAVYIYFFYYAGALMTETFFILAVLGILVFALEYSEQPNWKNSLLLGLCLGCGVLLRQTLLLFLPFLLIWMFWVKKRKFPIRHMAAVIGVPILIILPFTIRNYLVFHQFVLLNTNAGYAFFWGNHPVYGDHFLPILTEDMPSYRDLIPEELRSLNEAALDQALLKRGIGFVLEDPIRYIKLSISRIPAFFMFWPSAQSGLISNLSRVFSFGVMLPFMLFGVGVWILDVRRKKLDPAPGTLLLLFAFTFSAIHLLSWALIRYRLPVDAVMLIFAAYGLYFLIQRLSSGYTSQK